MKRRAAAVDTAAPAFRTYARDMLAFALSRPPSPQPPPTEGRPRPPFPPGEGGVEGTSNLPPPQAGEGRGGGETTPQPPPRPLIAYGEPARAWLESEFHLTLPVLGLATLTLADGTITAVLGANHPSFIWQAAKQSRALALEVMKQDLIAACWQARMPGDGAGEAKTTLAQCTATWNARLGTVCILTETQAFGTAEKEARKPCAGPAAEGTSR